MSPSLRTHSQINVPDTALARAEGIGLDVFYPIVPDSAWVARIVPLGVRSVQLRIKDASAEMIANHIDQSLKICREHGCQLIVNDHWQAAISQGADFIHLGQEDLEAAERDVIKRHGLRLGVSTHDDQELAVALTWEPDYIALGPIYETKLKAMAWSPQGLERLSAWKTRIGDLPLVGIGGITIDRAAGVLGAGAQSVSVITDFVNHKSPEDRIKQWLSWASENRARGSGLIAD